MSGFAVASFLADARDPTLSPTVIDHSRPEECIDIGDVLMNSGRDDAMAYLNPIDSNERHQDYLWVITQGFSLIPNSHCMLWNAA